MNKDIEALQQQLKQQEKLASLGMLTAGIAHEIQNPLNFVINFSKLSHKLLDDLSELIPPLVNSCGDSAAATPLTSPQDAAQDCAEIIEDLRSNLDKITEHGQRAISIIQSILLVSRGKDNEYIPSDVCNIVHEYVWLSYHAMRAQHKDFNVAIYENYQQDMPLVKVIPQDLSRAVLNIMNNACYTLYTRSKNEDSSYKPQITVSVTSHLTPLTSHLTPPSGGQGALVITIADNGEGMTEEVKQRLYENFFTTKPVGQGTGLGMGITRDIIENKHHGQLTFTSQQNIGTTFTITIPLQ